MKLLLLLLTIIVGCAVAVPRPEDHPGKCFLAEYDVAISPGQTFARAGNCVSYSCRPDLQVSMMPCALMHVDPRKKCKLTGEDNTKVYPHCCAQVECD